MFCQKIKPLAYDRIKTVCSSATQVRRDTKHSNRHIQSGPQLHQHELTRNVLLLRRQKLISALFRTPTQYPLGLPIDLGTELHNSLMNSTDSFPERF